MLKQKGTFNTPTQNSREVNFGTTVSKSRHALECEFTFFFSVETGSQNQDCSITIYLFFPWDQKDFGSAEYSLLSL